MDANTYQNQVLVTCCEYDDETRLRMQTEIRAIKVRLGLTIELGKRMDELKRYVYYKKGDVKTNADIQEAAVMQRLADVVEPLHGVIGLLTEVGEICEAFYRFIFDNQPIDVVNIAEEIGDLEWYEALLCECYNLRLGDVLQGNKDKLQKRFAGKFTAAAALGTRDVTSEQALVAAATTQRSESSDSVYPCSGCGKPYTFKINDKASNSDLCPTCYETVRVELAAEYPGEFLPDNHCVQVEETVQQIRTEDLLWNVEKCGFECEAGPLKNSLAWKELKKRFTNYIRSASLTTSHPQGISDIDAETA